MTPDGSAKRMGWPDRWAAGLVDGWLSLLCALLGLLLGGVRAHTRAFGADAGIDGTLARPIVWIPVLVLLIVQGVLATRGGTVGLRLVGWNVVSRVRDGDVSLRALGATLPPWIWGTATAFGMVVAAEAPRWQQPLSAAVWLVVGSNALLGATGERRSLVERVFGLESVSGRPPRRTFDPPAFSGPALSMAFAGTVFTGVLSAAVHAAALRTHWWESTGIDAPLILSTVTIVTGILGSGAWAGLRTRTFLVGEFALAALLFGASVLLLASTGLVPVAPLQRFQTPGPVDFVVYGVGTQLGLTLLLVLGGSLGFLLSSDRGLDAGIRFERRVAQRHLRLQWRHWGRLAVIATIVPVVLYGVVVWPIRSAWRLALGRPPPPREPPTVFMALLTIVGVLFGVMALNVVLAVMGGFEGDLKEKILGTNAHGVIHRQNGAFEDWRQALDTVRATPGVTGATPFVLSEVMITTDDSVSGAVLKGIDLASVDAVGDLSRNIEPGSGELSWLDTPDRIPGPEMEPLRRRDSGAEGDDTKDSTGDSVDPSVDRDGGGDPESDRPAARLGGIVLGKEMARVLGVWVGDTVTVMNPIGELGPSGPIPRSRPFRVAAIFVSGMYEYDTKFAYIRMADAQSFFRMKGAVSGIELRCADVEQARPLVRQIVQTLGGYPIRGRDWGEMNANLFSALRLERAVMFILLSFQVLIACICVVATLVMLVVEKRREVAVLKSMGAREASIMKLFVIEGLAIGGIGTLYGSAAGWLLCKMIERYGVDLDPQIYYITRLPVVIEPLTFLAVGLVSMVLVLLATLYPARRGGSIAPVEGFRDE